MKNIMRVFLKRHREVLKCEFKYNFTYKRKKVRVHSQIIKHLLDFLSSPSRRLAAVSEFYLRTFQTKSKKYF